MFDNYSNLLDCSILDVDDQIDSPVTELCVPLIRILAQRIAKSDKLRGFTYAIYRSSVRFCHAQLTQTLQLSMTNSHNLYEILGLTFSASSPPTPSDIKAAYHRSLLSNHPDKSSPLTTPTLSALTIDAIKSAYATLSNPTTRILYDRTLLTSTSHKSSSIQDALTGEERVDLDDMTYDDATASYFRTCRCGEARGHEASESDLEAEAARGAREVLVQCAGCTLWLRVEFSMVEDGGVEEPHDEGSRPPNCPQGEDDNVEIRLSG
jgi:diphthamide biosynthesis protein 4